MAPTPLDGVGKLAKNSVLLAAGGAATSVRIAMKSEELIEETIKTMQAARPVIAALSRALEDGLADDVRRLLATAADTQDDIRAAREAAERLLGLVNATIDGVGGAPGVQLVLKGIARLGGVPKPPSPVAAGVTAGAGAVKVGATAAKAGASAAKAGSAAARKVAAPRKKPAPKK